MIKANLFDFGGSLFEYSPSNSNLLAGITREYRKKYNKHQFLIFQGFPCPKTLYPQSFK